MSAPVKGRDEEPFTDAEVWTPSPDDVDGGTVLLPLTVGAVQVG